MHYNACRHSYIQVRGIKENPKNHLKANQGSRHIKVIKSGTRTSSRTKMISISLFVDPNDPNNIVAIISLFS